MKKTIPNALPGPVKTKIYKTGQTRGADDDVIFQNRVGRNSTVLFQLSEYDLCKAAPDVSGEYEKGYIVLIKPEDFFENNAQEKMDQLGLSLGNNALLFYETRDQWNRFNPNNCGFTPAQNRTNPLRGEYVARVPATTSKETSKIIEGFTTSSMKGAGIRVYEYASMQTIAKCKLQLEYLYWQCYDAIPFSLHFGFSNDEIIRHKEYIRTMVEQLKLNDHEKLFKARIIDKDGYTICPLCMEKISANLFCSKMPQAIGREVPDLTITEVSLFHINELRTGEFNHRPYNLGWGHHFCNVVVKDAGIYPTLDWMQKVLDNNKAK